MIRKAVSILLVLAIPLSGQSIGAVLQKPMDERAPIPTFKNLNFTPIAAGSAHLLNSPSTTVIEQGMAVSGYFLALPKITREQTLLVQAPIEDGSVYFPVIYVLDENRRVISETLPEDTKRILDPPAPVSAGFSIPIDVDHRATYLAITMPTPLKGKRMVTAFQERTAGVYLPGSTPVFIPGRSYDRIEKATFSSNAGLTVSLPYASEKEPLSRNNSIWIDLGATFSDTKIRGKDNGESFDLGGGAFFSIGYQQGLGQGWLRDTSWFIRGGYRGEMGKEEGSQTSFPIEVALLQHIKRFRIGFGYQVDLGYSIDTGDETYRFTSRPSPVLHIDYAISARASIGLVSWEAEYESDETGKLNADVTGIRLMADFGR